MPFNGLFGGAGYGSAGVDLGGIEDDVEAVREWCASNRAVKEAWRLTNQSHSWPCQAWRAEFPASFGFVDYMVHGLFPKWMWPGLFVKEANDA